MTKRVRTLADIAALAGVTPATVSRALAGHARISEETRRRVTEIAAAHRFQVNQSARNLRLGRTHAIGVVVPLGHRSAQRVSDPFYTSLIGHLMDGLAARDHAMLLSTVTPHDEDWLSGLARGGRVDGIIVLCQSDQDKVLRDAARAYRPMVVWGDAGAAAPPYCCVGTDNRRGGRIATEHLLGLGRRNIAFAGMTDIPELAARHAGYLDAHEAFGAKPGAHLPVPLAFDHMSSMIRDSIAPHPGIDGIVAASDMIAMAAIRALAELGRRVPEDVPVVGYDDVMLAAHFLPALTTIRQDLDCAAAVMIDLLFKRIRGEEADSVRIPLALVRRSSA